MNSDMRKGCTIRMFLVDGSVGGVVTLEIMNWSGHAAAAPRSKLPELLSRNELTRTGIYFLYGSQAESGDMSVYIGEGDNVGQRIRAHIRDEEKDFWEKVCVFTSKDLNLTKAHVRYLESRLIEITKQAGRAVPVNSQNPGTIRLPEADQSDMEDFIDRIRLVLPVLGMDVLRFTHTGDAAGNSDDVVFELKSPSHPAPAAAIERDGEFIVLKGSPASARWSRNETRASGYSRVHQALIEKGKIVIDTSGTALFTTDVSFSSPSAAAAVVRGRSASGPREWRVKGTRKSYADWQNEQLDIMAGIAADIPDDG